MEGFNSGVKGLILIRKTFYILHYVTIHCDFQEYNSNIKQGCTVIKFVQIEIKSQSSVCQLQIGM
jgi:RIO-like serine/threonine protein kinase